MQGMIGQDESGSNPNISKDLTDEQKKELGGSGSKTETPLPPENDPNKSGEKKVDKLNQKQESAMRKIDNLIKNSLKDHDIVGWIILAADVSEITWCTLRDYNRIARGNDKIW